MAWRIDEAVVRGEIDNRTKGRVTGVIWFVGSEKPVRLELAGNCWRDLAGRRLVFVNLRPKPAGLERFSDIQQGVVGDITASRKVKVPDFPPEELPKYYKTGRKWTWHWGNSLYLEWFSERNGRVVIETTAFDLQIDGEAAWEMTEEDEIEQRRANSAALTGFMERLVDAVGGDRESGGDTLPDGQHRPQTEAEAEAQQARSDRLADRIEARLRREGENADYEQILEEEMERLDREEGRREPTFEDKERSAHWVEEINRAAEEAAANPDPEMEREMNFRHPLVERVTDFSHQLRETAKAEGWREENSTQEHPINELLDATMIAGPKLAGALNGNFWPPDLDFCAHVIVRLKRARGYLEDALRATESCHEEKLLKPVHLGPIVSELTDFIQETDDLIAELRAKLDRGTD